MICSNDELSTEKIVLEFLSECDNSKELLACYTIPGLGLTKTLACIADNSFEVSLHL